MAQIVRALSVFSASAMLLGLMGCGTARDVNAEASEPAGPLTTLKANVIVRATCEDAPWALDLDTQKRLVSDFVKFEPINQLAKGNCQLEYKPVDPRIQVVPVTLPGGSDDAANWTVDPSNPQEAGLGIGKDDVVYLLIHGENLGKVKVPHGEDIKLGPGLTSTQQAKNIQQSTLYSHAQNTWK